jgi:hypothetical protein
MSTLYNRRRGGHAHRARCARNPRQCRAGVMPGLPDIVPSYSPAGSNIAGCPRLALRNRYCAEHQRGGPERCIEPTRRSGHPRTRRPTKRPFLAGWIARLKKRARRQARELRKREAVS